MSSILTIDELNTYLSHAIGVSVTEEKEMLRLAPIHATYEEMLDKLLILWEDPNVSFPELDGKTFPSCSPDEMTEHDFYRVYIYVMARVLISMGADGIERFDASCRSLTF